MALKEGREVEGGYLHASQLDLCLAETLTFLVPSSLEAFIRSHLLPRARQVAIEIAKGQTKLDKKCKRLTCLPP